MHGRLQTDRHSIGLSAISGSAARRSASAANRSAPSGPSSDLQVTQTRRVAAGRLSARHAVMREVGERSSGVGAVLDCFTASRLANGSMLARIGSGQVIALLGRPSGGVAEFIGARQVSWLAAYRRRRLPGLESSPVARKASARRSQSRGRPRIGERPTVFPFHPLARSRDRARLMFQLRGGLSNEGDRSTRQRLARADHVLTRWARPPKSLLPRVAKG